MRFVVLLLAVALVGCAERRPKAAAAGVSVDIPLACVTSDIHLEMCDKGYNCKRVRFSHRVGCEVLKVGK